VLALRAETVHRIPCDGLVELRAGFALAFALPPRRRLAARALRQHARRLLRSGFAEEQAMSSTTAISRVERRHGLLRPLQAQCQVIAQRLGPASGINDGFPRSHAMRVLIQHPAPVIRLLMGLLTLVRTK